MPYTNLGGPEETGAIILEEEGSRLAMVIREITSQIAIGETEIQKQKRVITGQRDHITDEYGSVPKSFDELVDLAGGMQMLKAAGAMQKATLMRQSQLQRLRRSAYFGRIDFAMSKGGVRAVPRAIYVGVSSLGKKEGGEHLIFDWRAPICSVYYDHELGEAQYESPGGIVRGEVLVKRHFRIKEDKILVMYDNSLTIFDEILQETLGQATGDRMRSIVNTIQREQNQIIRDSGRRVLLVQGCAGSGKTSIALHRAAYLLYKHRKDMDADSILMVTPNRVFIDYTSLVLPELGEEPLRQVAFSDLALDLLLGDAPELDDPSLKEDRQLMALSGSEPSAPSDALQQMRYLDFADQTEDLLDLRRRKEPKGTENPAYVSKVAAIAQKSSLGYGDRLWSFAQSLTKSEARPKAVDFRGRPVITDSQIEELLSKDYAYLPPAKRVDKAKRRILWLLDGVRRERVTELRAQIAKDPDNIHLLGQDIEEMAEFRALRELRPLRDKIRSWTPVDLLTAYRRFLEDGTRWGLDPEMCEDTLLTLGSGVVPYEDLAALVLLKLSLLGLREWTDIRHVIVDESQDYSAMQYKVLRAAFPRAAFTVLGDLNQSMSPHVRKDEEVPYGGALGGLGADASTRLLRLDTSYRSTREITSFAKGILDGGEPVEPIERPGKEPEIVASFDMDSLASAVAGQIDAFMKEGYVSIAVICKTAREAWSALERLKPLTTKEGRPTIRLVTKEERRFSRGPLLIPSYLAKGLEFEAVIIYNASQDAFGLPDDRQVLYTACTRALHRLVVNHVGPLTRFICTEVGNR